MMASHTSCIDMDRNMDLIFNLRAGYLHLSMQQLSNSLYSRWFSSQLTKNMLEVGHR